MEYEKAGKSQSDQLLTSLDPRPKPLITFPSICSGKGDSGPGAGPTTRGLVFPMAAQLLFLLVFPLGSQRSRGLPDQGVKWREALVCCCRTQDAGRRTQNKVTGSQSPGGTGGNSTGGRSPMLDADFRSHEIVAECDM